MAYCDRIGDWSDYLEACESLMWLLRFDSYFRVGLIICVRAPSLNSGASSILESKLSLSIRSAE